MRSARGISWTVVLFLLLVAVGCGSGGRRKKGTPQMETGDAVGRRGAKVFSRDRCACVLIPARALRERVVVLVEPSPGAPAGQVGNAYEFRPFDVVLERAVTVCVSPCGADLGGAAFLDLRLARAVGAAWVEVPGSVADPAAGTVCAPVDAFGVFGLIADLPPAARAGLDQRVAEGTLVLLDASASGGDPGPRTFRWTQTAGTEVVLSDPDGVMTTFVAPDVGAAGESLVFDVAVTDARGRVSVDSVIVQVDNVNQAPLADAGPDQAVSEGESATLDGSGSADRDGTISAFRWRQTAGRLVALSDDTGARPVFTAPEVGPAGETLGFELTVTDDMGLLDTDSVLVQVLNANRPPIADAGPDQSAREGDVVTLSGASSADPDGVIVVFKWSQKAGAPVLLSDSLAESPTFAAPEVTPAGETLVFELEVTDDLGLMDTDEVLVQVLDVNRPPLADAGPDQSASEGDIVQLDASGSSDPDFLAAARGAADLRFNWSQTRGAPVALSDPLDPRPTFTAPLVGPEGETLAFEVEVTDGLGLADRDDVLVQVLNVNQPPVSDAGPDAAANEGEVVTLDGRNSADPDGRLVELKWSQLAGPPVALSDAMIARPSFTTPEVGPAGATLIFELMVTDDGGLSDTDTVLVQVVSVNVPPIADAGPDQVVNEGQVVVLDGSGSRDPDGAGLGAGGLALRWTQISGTPVALSDAASVRPSFTAPDVRPEGEALVFELSATDELGLMDNDTVLIAVADVNQPPIANAGSDLEANEGEVATLDGSRSLDPDGAAVSFQWSQRSGTAVELSDPRSPRPFFSAPQVGPQGEVLGFELTVSDALGAQSRDSVDVRVRDVNQPPLAAAGPDQEVAEDVLVVLDGRSSVDPDGAIASFLWVETLGLSVELSDPRSANPSFRSPEVGPAGATLFFTLTVTDTLGATAVDTATVNVINVNRPPLAAAGGDQSVSEGATVRLDGTNSSDADGSVAAFSWRQTLGPAVAISGAATANASFSAPEVGPAGETLAFELLVTDDLGLMDTDDVLVQVLNVNRPPVADAGADRSAREGDAVVLDGASSVDQDGAVVAFAWRQTRGVPVLLAGAATARPSFTGPAVSPAGETLAFELSVTDDLGLMDTDEVLVQILNVNLPPIADAGADRSVREGVAVVLSGANSSDPEGTIASVSWQQTSGPTVVLSDPIALSPTFTAPEVGAAGATLAFDLVVTDDLGLVDTDSVNVEVLNVNRPPAADAGPDQEVREGEEVALSGANSADPDGQVVAFRWSQRLGRPVVLSNPAASSPRFSAPDVGPEGETLAFVLTVTDDLGLEDSDEVLVQVLNVNRPPLADAGDDQSSAEGQTVSLDGSRSADPDGRLVAFRWTQSRGSPVALSDPTVLAPSFSAPSVGPAGETLGFMLSVTDDGGLMDTDEVLVQVLNVNLAPIADAGDDLRVAEGTVVTLDGGSSGDPDGTVASFRWSQSLGVPVRLSDSMAAAPTFTAPEVGVAGERLVFELAVTDDLGLMAVDTVEVLVVNVNRQPMADAGPDLSVSEGDLVLLDGRNSADADGVLVSFEWSQLGGTTVELSDPTSPTPSFIAPEVGPEGETIVFELAVSDDGDLRDTDSVLIQVVNVNRPPVAAAGGDLREREGDTVGLDGEGSVDPDGTIAAFRWRQTRGRAVVLAGALTVGPSFTAAEVGPAGETLAFELTVTDDLGLTDTDEVLVEVLNVNRAPLADAGADQSVREGDLAGLSAAGSTDADGVIAAFVWRQESGPPVTLSGAASAGPSFTAPEVGPQGATLVFELTVTDDLGLTDTDQVSVDVLNVNRPPIADAGADQTVSEGEHVFLSGDRSADPDGFVVSFLWRQTSGAPVVISGATSLSANFMAPQVAPEGESLVFELAVTDDLGLTDTDDVTVAVENVNQAPLANAGADQSAREGDLVTLSGAESSDPDGEIAAFAWRQTRGTEVVISSPASARVSFTAPEVGPAGEMLAFELTVTDDLGAMTSDEVLVDVLNLNRPPIADAGRDQSVREGDAVLLSGAGSTDPDGAVVAFAWRQTAGTAVALADSSSASPGFTAPEVGPAGAILAFELTVTDDLGFSDSAEVRVEVLNVNRPPQADAGGDQNVRESETVVLNGGGSTDPDGAIASFAWRQTRGAAVVLSSATSASPSFTAPDVGPEGSTLAFELTVTDDLDATDSDEVLVGVVNVNQPPLADAGADQSVREDIQVVLDGSLSADTDGSIASFRWRQTRGTEVALAGALTAGPSFISPGVNPAGETLVFELTVTDDLGLMDTDEVLVQVLNVNQPPLADAGGDQNVREGDPVVLDGGASMDPDGRIATFRWRQVRGSAVTLSDPTSPAPAFTAPETGPAGETLEFELTVTDDLGLMDTDAVLVQVLDVNRPPVADAGRDQSVAEAAIVVLDGRASTDSDGRIAAFRWRQTRGAAVVLEGALMSQPSFIAPQVGPAGETLAFELTVTDDLGLMDSDEVLVQVIDVNRAPLADAGADQSVREGDAVVLDGGASMDPDGRIAAFRWRQSFGPPVALVGSTTPSPTFVAPEVDSTGAMLVFELVVTDDLGLMDTDEVQVQVVNVNRTPTADAGSDREVSEGEPASLDGRGSTDADGTIVSFQWRQLSGPAAVLTGAASATPTFTAPQVGPTGGELVFELTVTDELGATDTDTVSVQVINVNQRPVANAGPDQQVNEGSAVSLDGRGSRDPDGSIATFRWRQTSGPAVNLANATSATPSFTAPQVSAAGATLQFELTVTDDNGASAADTVTVLVANVNQRPISNAGADQQVGEGALVSLDGSASRDPDGSIASFRWRQTSGPAVALSSTTAASPTFRAPVVSSSGATLVFELTVTDDLGASASDTVTVVVTNINQPPQARATAPAKINAGVVTVLDASASTDPDGVIVSFFWRQVSGAPVSLANFTTSRATFTASAAGRGNTLVFEVVVTDDAGAVSLARVSIVVNRPPVADARPGTGNECAAVGFSLDGRNSFDPEGRPITSFRWQRISGAAATLTNATSPVACYSPSAEGTYIFRLTVTDECGASSFDDVSVTILF